MDRLDAMRLFVRVVESGSFSAAARDAGVGQPAVCKQIAALEAHLGAQLVQRTSRRITVTSAGQIFYESALRLVEDAEAAESLVGKGLAARSLRAAGRLRYSSRSPNRAVNSLANSAVPVIVNVTACHPSSSTPTCRS